MKNRSASMLFALMFVVLAGVTYGAAAGDADPAPAVTTVSETAEPAPSALAQPPRTTVPSCGESPSTLVPTGIEIVIEEADPKGYCHCNVDADCKAKCGDRGGSCLITIPCEEPTRYSGWCYCGYGSVN